MWDHIRHAGSAAWAVVGIVALLAICGVVAWYVRVIWPPLILAGAIVFVLNPVVTYLQDRGIRRVVGTALTYLGVVMLFGLAGLAVWPLASDQAAQLSDDWPEIRSDLENQINDWAAESEANDWFIKVPSVEEIEAEFSGGDEDLGERIATLREVGVRIFEVGIIIVLAPILAFYLLVDTPHLRIVAEGLIPENAKQEVVLVSRRLNQAIGGFFRGQLFVALLVGILVSVPLAIIGLPFWLLVGMIAGLFNIIPLIGPWVGAVPGVIIALTTRDFGTALIVVGVMAGAQQIDNHFISPLVMRRAVKLHPAAVMIALLAGGTLGGFFGLLLAVPIAAVIKILAGHLWHHWVLAEPLEELERAFAGVDAEEGVGFVERVGEEPELQGRRPDDAQT